MEVPASPTEEFILLCGIPDRGLEHSRLISAGETINFLLPGTADFISEMPEDIRKWRKLFLPMDPDKSFPVRGRPLLVNHMGDADCYIEALTQATGIVEGNNLSCFNHPRHVARLRRDTLGEIYGHIEGLIIPKCINLIATNVLNFHIILIENNLKYPVICRLAGTHGGKTQKLIPSAEAWSEIHEIPWHNSKVYLTEFVDYRDGDGFYRKQRVSVVGGEVIPRHGCLNYQWSVSAEDSPPETIEEEVQWNKTFFEKEWPVLKERFKEIIQATKLDYFGIDYSLRPDGKILLFEITASMSMTRPFSSPTHQAIEYIPKMIQDKLAGLLRKPSAWLEYRGA